MQLHFANAVDSIISVNNVLENVIELAPSSEAKHVGLPAIVEDRWSSGIPSSRFHTDKNNNTTAMALRLQKLYSCYYLQWKHLSGAVPSMNLTHTGK